jgi:hypothetical protein
LREEPQSQLGFVLAHADEVLMRSQKLNNNDESPLIDVFQDHISDLSITFKWKKDEKPQEEEPIP